MGSWRGSITNAVPPPEARNGDEVSETLIDDGVHVHGRHLITGLDFDLALSRVSLLVGENRDALPP